MEAPRPRRQNQGSHRRAGDANGLTQLLDVAEQLKHRSDIAIILIGEGKMRPLLIQAAKDRGLSNIHMHEPVQKMQIPGILAAADVGLMILKQITRPRWVTPNKIFDYMFAGLPSIVNFAGTTAELVEADGVGVAAKPGDAADLASRLLYWADHPEERKAIGQHAREVAFGKYDRQMIAKELGKIFDDYSVGYSLERK
ncbi:MAG: glycosyltransferase [Planctomycetes bacterium]|nr:glycosyltransferase [Planctomycetota bacterium]